MADLEDDLFHEGNSPRQPHPVGDKVYGQAVQNLKEHPLHTLPKNEAKHFEYLAAAVTKGVLLGAPCNLLQFSGENTNAAVRWLLIFDKNAAPIAGEKAVMSRRIPAGSATSPGMANRSFIRGLKLNSGLAWAISTTSDTFTDSATASEHLVYAEVE